MDERIPVALVGAGWVAEHAYVAAVLRSRFRPAMVYDPDPSRAARLASLLGLGGGAPSFDACLDESIPAVILCTPAYLHASQLRRFLSASKFVLCEKPVLQGTAELDDIASLAGADRMMGSAATRLREDVALLLKWVRGGRIGRLRRVRLGWWRECGVPGPGTWRTDVSLSPDGVFADLGPHLLDIAAAVLPGIPRKPVRVVSSSFECRHGSAGRAAQWFAPGSRCQYVVPDTARAVLETTGAVAIEIETCWTGETPGDLCSVRFEGTRGTASLQGLFGFSQTRRLPEQTCSLEIGGTIVDRHHFPQGPVLQQRAFAMSVARFARFCAGRGVAAANFAEVAQVALWMQAIRDAARRPERTGAMHSIPCGPPGAVA